jgi:predicted dehydrogenase
MHSSVYLDLQRRKHFKMNPINVAIVGCGIGKEHADAYLKLPDQFQLAAICDLDQVKAQAFADAYHIPHVTADLESLCALREVDVVDICTPSHLHFAHTQQVLRAGKHAICEKPVAASIREVDELMQLEAQLGARVMPIFQYRFGHGLQKLKRLVESGVAGKAYVSTVEVMWRRRADYYAVPWRGKWKTELGGTLVTHAIHALDALLYILGDVKSVYAHITTRVNAIETEDCAAISFEMADGSVATLAATVGSAVEITRHRFCFSNLVAESNTHPYANTRDPWTFTGDTPEAKKQIEVSLSQFAPELEWFEGQFTRFYEAMRNGAPLPVTLSDARSSLAVLRAIYDSARAQKIVEMA